MFEELLFPRYNRRNPCTAEFTLINPRVTPGLGRLYSANPVVFRIRDEQVAGGIYGHSPG
jgi:hypothetical protein